MSNWVDALEEQIRLVETQEDFVQAVEPELAKLIAAARWAEAICAKRNQLILSSGNHDPSLEPEAAYRALRDKP